MPATFEDICDGLRQCGIDGLDKMAERVAQSESVTLEVPVRLGLTQGPDQKLVFDRMSDVRSRLVFDSEGVLDPEQSAFNLPVCPCPGCPAVLESHEALPAHLAAINDALAPDASDQSEFAQMVRAHEAAETERESNAIRNDRSRTWQP